MTSISPGAGITAITGRACSISTGGAGTGSGVFGTSQSAAMTGDCSSAAENRSADEDSKKAAMAASVSVCGGVFGGVV